MAMIGHGASVGFEKSAFAGNLRSISGPGITIDSVDSSYMGTTYMVREFIPGMLNPGEITLEIIFDPDEMVTHDPFSDAYMAGGWVNDAAVTETVTITWPVPYNLTNGATWAASGFITGVSPEAPMEDLMTASVTVQLTGDITYAAAT